MKRSILCWAILLCGFASLTAQDKGYGWPMDFLPVSFSSTYGELRRNHFHAGLDWRTGGHTGEKLYSIMDGYVCRLSVSPTGYGNAVYIAHPNGTMSVYGHMESFRSDLARRVRSEQYAQKSYRVTIELSEGEFPVKKGDFIGRAGNSGFSGGPHLHMEIRRDWDNLPVNYLADGTYNLRDTKPPVINRVAFYAFEDSTGIPMVRRLQMISNPKGYKGTITVSDKFYVAVDAVDYMEGTGGRLAVECYQVWLDSEKIFDFKVGDVPYSEGRYFACLVQQGEKGHDLLKSWCPPNNGLAYKIQSVNDGIISLEDDAPHTVKVVAADCFGNSTSCSFSVKRGGGIRVMDPADTVGLFAALWYVPQVFTAGGVSMYIEPASLNASAYLDCRKVGSADPSQGIYSDIWRFASEDIHLQKPVHIKFDISALPENLQAKAYIAKKGADGLSYAGNKHSGTALEAACKFGTFFVAVDTDAPHLKSNVADGASLPASGRFSIDARDGGSGIADYDIKWDGEWILSQYYGGRIQVYPDKSHRSGGRHRIEVTATDHCGNSCDVEFYVIY